MRYKPRQSGIAHLVIILIILVAAVVGFAGWKVLNSNSKSLPSLDVSGNKVSYDQVVSRSLTGGDCRGAGTVSLTAPMRPEQIGIVLPYGEVVGGHVTPIDHQYYWGPDNRALRDAYDVLAPGDGVIVNIGHRGSKTNTPPNTVDVPSSDEYRLVFMHTCSFLTYEDLVTSLTPDIVAKLPGGHTLVNSDVVNVHIPVKKGQLIGHIGGQTLDFAAWDLSKPLKGFVDYADYAAEAWKPYTAPPSQYMDTASKAAVVAKYVRTAAPIDGKIDYDIDGKLIGNWFQVGTGGYHARTNTKQAYWEGHLSIAPDNIDPTAYVASIGNYGAYPGAAVKNNDITQADNHAAQFMLVSATPDPATVGVGSLAKYQIVLKKYALPDGTQWNSSSFATGLKATPDESPVGTIIAQLTAKRTLKFEAFPGKTPDQVSGFDNSAVTYTR